MSVENDRKNHNLNEEEFLKKYDASIYDRPSLTVDVLVFSIDLAEGLKILLTRRNDMPYKGLWSIPGGFVAMDQSLEDAAEAKLKEKTGVQGIHMEQLYTFGDVGRDPRTRVITVSYLALIPANRISEEEITEDASWFTVTLNSDGILLDGQKLPLAFDHEKMITVAIERLRGKLSYTDIAFDFAKDRNRFAIYELQKIHEAIMGYKMDTPNFRRMVQTTYLKTGRAEETGEKCVEYAGRSSKYYRMK